MMYPYGNYGYGYGYGMGFGVWGFAVHAVLTVLTIIIVLWLIRRFVFGRDGHGMRHWRNRWAVHSGLEILNERFAKGEIDKTEYEERKKALLGE